MDEEIKKNDSLQRRKFLEDKLNELNKRTEIYTCPLTLEIMKIPVTAAKDGRNYEEEAIIKWIAIKGNSPFNRSPMTERDLIKNFMLKQEIENWSKEIEAVENELKKLQ